MELVSHARNALRSATRALQDSAFAAHKRPRGAIELARLNQHHESRSYATLRHVPRDRLRGELRQTSLGAPSGDILNHSLSPHPVKWGRRDRSAGALGHAPGRFIDAQVIP